METIEAINAEIEKKKFELETVKGTDCEVHTRIVGYYRSIRNWNDGKKAEFKSRHNYKIPAFT